MNTFFIFVPLYHNQACYLITQVSNRKFQEFFTHIICIHMSVNNTNFESYPLTCRANKYFLSIIYLTDNIEGNVLVEPLQLAAKRAQLQKHESLIDYYKQLIFCFMKRTFSNFIPSMVLSTSSQYQRSITLKQTFHESKGMKAICQLEFI